MSHFSELYKNPTTAVISNVRVCEIRNKQNSRWIRHVFVYNELGLWKNFEK